MTLTRPAFAVTVTNHTRGWSISMAQGDTPDPDAGAWLTDAWSIDTELERPWGPAFKPTVTSFDIFARDQAELPDIDYDDEVSVVLARPQAVGDPTVIVEGFGPVTDLDADTATINDGDTTVVVLHVIVTDPSSILAALRSGWGTNLGMEEPGGLVTADAALAAVGAATRLPIATKGGGVSPWNLRSLHDPDEDVATTFQKIASSVGDAAPSVNRPGVLRVAHRWDGPDAPWTFQEGVGPYRYYLGTYEPYLPVTASVTALLAVEVQGRKVTAVPDGAGLSQTALTAMSACLAQSPMAWSKNAGNAPTAVKVTYPFKDGELDQTGEYEASTWNNPASKGADLEVATQLANRGTSFPASGVYTNGVPGAGDRMAALLAATPAWGVASVTVLPEAMTDAEWDLYCTRFYPRPEPIGDTIGRYLVLTEIDEEINLAGVTLVTQLLGAKYSAPGGDLRIELATFARPFLLAPGVTDANVPGPTVNAWNAVPGLVNTTATDQGGSTPYIDPRVTADDMKLAHL